MNQNQMTNGPPEYTWVDIYTKNGSSWVFRRRVAAPEDGNLNALRNRMCRELAPSPAIPLEVSEVKLETMLSSKKKPQPRAEEGDADCAIPRDATRAEKCALPSAWATTHTGRVDRESIGHTPPPSPAAL